MVADVSSRLHDIDWGEMQGRHSAIHMSMHDPTRATLDGVAPETEDPCRAGQTGACHGAVGRRPSFAATARQVELRERHVRTWALRFAAHGIDGLSDKKRPGRQPGFSPGGGVVRGQTGLASVLTWSGRSLSQWDSAELARQLVHDGVVEAMSPQTVQRILATPQADTLAPSSVAVAPGPTGGGVCGAGAGDCGLVYPPLGRRGKGAVRGRENQSAAPDAQSPHLGRPTGPTRPGRTRVHRKGALNLFAGFDTRTGKVYATTAERKRQVECIACVGTWWIGRFPRPSRRFHVVLDHVRMHKGKQVQAWLAKHPRFVWHFPPVHGSWMNQVAPWFSIGSASGCRAPIVADTQHLAERLMAFVAEWNAHAHPFRWSTTSVAKVMAKCENPVAKAA